MKRHLLYLTALACLCLSGSTARADLLIASTSLSQQGGFSHADDIRFVLEFTTDIGWGDAVAPLFNQSITPADVGKTFTADSSTPFFANNMALAHNGNNNRVGFSILNTRGAGGGSLFYEAEFFYGAPHSPFYAFMPDLMWQPVTRATFHLDKFTIVPQPGGASQGDGIQYDFEGTVSFFDDLRDTPEPTSYCLALLGGLGVFAWRKRSKKLAPCQNDVSLQSRLSGDWRLSIAPDSRIKGLNDLRKVKGSDFEVIVPTGPDEGPRGKK